MEMRVMMICFADILDVSVDAASAPASADGDRVSGGAAEHDVDGGPLHGGVHPGRS